MFFIHSSIATVHSLTQKQPLHCQTKRLSSSSIKALKAKQAILLVLEKIAIFFYYSIRSLLNRFGIRLRFLQNFQDITFQFNCFGGQSDINVK